MKSLLLPLFLISLYPLNAQHVPTFEETISLRSVRGVQLSPDGKTLAFTVQTTDWNDNRYDTEIWLAREDDKPFQLTNNPKNNSTDPLFSPDGKWISFLSDRGNKNQIYVMRAEGGEPKAVTNEVEGISFYEWHSASSHFIFVKPEKEDKNKKELEPTGIFGTIWSKTNRPLYKIDPVTGEYSVLKKSPDQIFDISFSKDGQKVAFVGRNGNQLGEVFIATLNGEPNQITNMSAQIKDWKVAQSEVINWKSKDGATIEGVLHKPMNYDPTKKYPLLVVIHGGPTGIDTPSPIPGSVYPIVQWLNKGCLVLRPNYRGSAGYGEGFRSLNVKNLGVGDMWDVMSGIDYLDQKGMIDKTKMGCMGWSQGGYISAFLTTNTDVFKAISVGAGISNWMTYYVSTDIHPFTRQYLKATPWSDESIYKKTSPMTNINKAKTPTLIQHGEFDRRVPIANAYELLQGLRDKNVPAELVVYKGFGHGISKPKERLAANWHNWQWFNKYLWGEKIDLPLGEKNDGSTNKPESKNK